jgi:hypothetical protein
MRVICELSEEYAKSDALIEWLINNYKGDEDTIFQLLKNTGQEHIVNYIKADGRMFCLFRLFTLASDFVLMSFLNQF